jgi:hypothetical protein
VFGTIGFVENDPLCLNGNFAHPGNGIPGIDTQVGQNLVNLRGVHFDRPQLGSRHPNQIDILSDSLAKLH